MMEARKRLGLVGYDLSSLRKQSFLDSVMRVRSGRACTFHREDEVQNLERQLRDRVTAAGVGERLGIATYGAKDLIECQMITPYAHPFFEARFGEAVTSSAALEKFVTRLHAAAKAPAPDGVARTLPLSKLVQAIGARQKLWRAIAELLLSGELNFKIQPGR